MKDRLFKVFQIFNFIFPKNSPKRSHLYSSSSSSSSSISNNIALRLLLLLLRLLLLLVALPATPAAPASEPPAAKLELFLHLPTAAATRALRPGAVPAPAPRPAHGRGGLLVDAELHELLLTLRR